MPRLLPFLLLPLAFALAGCDQIAVLDGSKARADEGVAIGSACRQAGRPIEDCFTLNPDAPKASVFAGWKDMNDYMVANKLDVVKPEVPRPEPPKEEPKPEKDAKSEKKKKKSDEHAEADDEDTSAAATQTKVAGVPAEPAAAAPVASAAPVNKGSTIVIPGATPKAAVAAVAAEAQMSAPPVPKAAPTAATPPGTIALGGQNIPISVPGAAPSAH